MIFRESGTPNPEKETKYKTIVEHVKGKTFEGTLETKFNLHNEMVEMVVKNLKGEVIFYENVELLRESGIKPILLDEAFKEHEDPEL